MNVLEISLKLFEKFEAVEKIIGYPGILSCYGLMKTAESLNDEALLEKAAGLLRKYPERKDHPRYNFKAYEIGGIASAYAFMKGYLPEFGGLIREYADELMAAPRDPGGLVKSPLQQDRDLVWIDSVMMVTPFLLFSGLALNEQRYIDEAVKQALGHYDALMDESCGLLHQCKNFVAKGTLTPDHWGRGNGWGYIALTELVAFLPKDHPRRERVEEYFGRHSLNLLRHQSRHGMWRQEIPLEYSYEESSATALILYGFGVGMRRGLLDKNSFMAPFEDGLRGLFTFAIDKEFNTYLCCRGCRCPGFAEDKGTLQAYLSTMPLDNDAHSFGTMMLAFGEAHKTGVYETEKMKRYSYKKEWDT